MDAVSLIRSGQETETPWRFRLDELGWRDMVTALGQDTLPFAGLWCDGADVHALFMPSPTQPLAATLALENGRYPALSPARAVSSLYERMAYDLYGVEAMWAVDVRPLVDHEVWSATAPLDASPGLAGGRKGQISFQPSETLLAAGGVTGGVGPATGGTETSLHVAMAVSGETIVAAETVSGYAHRGLAARWRNSRLEDACRLSGRVVAGCSVAHQAAFSQAVEAACGSKVGPETALIRVVLMELERILLHLHTLAGLARGAGALLVASRCAWFREKLLALSAPVIGSRLLMDHCVPGGTRLREATGLGDLCTSLAKLGDEIYPGLATLWQTYPALSVRLSGVGPVDAALLDRVGLDGPVARAAGRDCDGRRTQRVYQSLWRLTAGRQGGTAEDRALILLDEIGESLRMLGEAGPRLGLTAGGRVDLSPDAGEGLGMAEGPWGTVLYWVRLHAGRVAQVFVHDPAPAALMVFEAALPGQDLADLGLLRQSLGVNAAALDG
ncbi:NADH-ubiquinone oxidoreductase 49kDa subunit [Acetobacter orleanensis NRIC 0473]|uniref:Formate hydrogenlyase/hydrogenase/NADH dehydrogenase subunit n=2 Tax=Acetobacter orleanensis TaxID=104099 RepID=A0A4Y3TGG5_9PROT|nr:NADH-ubiquinone oxidoreductase [Acetobacter orleanensis]PCD80613.1 NADH-quinone oxidoreductase subunit D [Acetobacter orleanensis]GAN68056.1 NADH-ubiquinone oxidoreductase 49kDa subunit [Acetobacter orleanensis JCM 7639]GBR27197.1 NADH-ubiquinone oxidoreductase 49kDa subunit [Acetobacter orleanensis NRIC 0473]GEB82021.1 formate hydrogenlyase/hydrogenase/NADH dehydrogenase subunit [Acetobacter orleanensis]